MEMSFLLLLILVVVLAFLQKRCRHSMHHNNQHIINIKVLQSIARSFHLGASSECIKLDCRLLRCDRTEIQIKSKSRISSRSPPARTISRKLFIDWRHWEQVGECVGETQRQAAQVEIDRQPVAWLWNEWIGCFYVSWGVTSLRSSCRISSKD